MLSWEPLKIMSYGGGTPSMTVVLMACQNSVPDYGYNLFCASTPPTCCVLRSSF